MRKSNFHWEKGNSEERFSHVTDHPFQGFNHFKCLLQVPTNQFLESQEGNGSGTTGQFLKFETYRQQLKSSRDYVEEQKSVNNLDVSSLQFCESSRFGKTNILIKTE